MRMCEGERTDILIIKSLVKFMTLALRKKLLPYTVIEFSLDEERNVKSKVIIFMVTFLIATAMREIC